MNRTTARQELAATDIFAGDWDDEGTTSVALPLDIADQLLTLRGWKMSGQGAWISPTGSAYWHIEEALQVALTAETI